MIKKKSIDRFKLSNESKNTYTYHKENCIRKQNIFKSALFQRFTPSLNTYGKFLTKHPNISSHVPPTSSDIETRHDPIFESPYLWRACSEPALKTTFAIRIFFHTTTQCFGMRGRVLVPKSAVKLSGNVCCASRTNLDWVGVVFWTSVCFEGVASAQSCCYIVEDLHWEVHVWCARVHAELRCQRSRWRCWRMG